MTCAVPCRLSGEFLYPCVCVCVCLFRLRYQQIALSWAKVQEDKGIDTRNGKIRGGAICLVSFRWLLFFNSFSLSLSLSDRFVQ